MGGGRPRRRKTLAAALAKSRKTLVDYDREAGEQVRRLVAARKAAANLARETMLANRARGEQDGTARTPPPPPVSKLPPMPDQVAKESAADVRVKRLERLAKVRAEQMAASRERAAAARAAGKVEGTAEKSVWRATRGDPAQAPRATPQEQRASDMAYQGWLKQHAVPEGVRVFSLSETVKLGKNKVLRQYLLDAGLVENEDAKSEHWDFRWILSRNDVDWSCLRPWQAVNSFEPTTDQSSTHYITKKIGLGRALKSGGWVGADVETFFPRQFDCSDADERVAFLREFLYCKAQAELRRWVGGGSSGRSQMGGLAMAAALAAAGAEKSVAELSRCTAALAVCKMVLKERRGLVDAHGSDSDGEEEEMSDDSASDKDAVVGGEDQWLSMDWELLLGTRDGSAARSCLGRATVETRTKLANQVRLFAGAAEETVARTSHLSREEQASASSAAFKRAMAARTAARAWQLETKAKRRALRMNRSKRTQDDAEQIDEVSTVDVAPTAEEETAADPAAVREAAAEAARVIASLQVVDPQWDLLGTAGAWVAKPASQSRGRGITVSGSLSKLLTTMGHGMHTGKAAPKLEQMSACERMNATTSQDWIAQKYVESPSLIDGKKWDVRMWAVVTCWDPLTIWFYQVGS